MPEISQLSRGSIFVRLVRRNADTGHEVQVGVGTAFLARTFNQTHLVTNWHVLTGTNPLTGALMARYIPNEIIVEFHSDEFETPTPHRYPLYDESGKPNWYVHPTRGNAVDVATMPVAIGGAFTTVPNPTVHVEPYELELADRAMRIEPTTEVSIVGFPYGQHSTGTLGIWSRGTIATEPSLDYQGDPVFLVDCRARKGQSGSPVVAYRPAHSFVPFASGHSVVSGGPYWELLGIYSGRISKKSDLGRVWKRETIAETISGGVRDTFELV